MEERSNRRRRFVAVIAATVISLACGTNYAYSAWAPQFAEKLSLTATQSNLIGTAGNIGMYACGIPFGAIVDKRGPHLNVIVGAFLMGGGYWPLRQAYLNGPGSMSVFTLFFFSLLTGAGSCAAFIAAIKIAALNWPLHRGTATAFPLAAFGLSAFFFSSISHIFFPDSTPGYLLLLTIGTFLMVFLSVFFVYVPHAEEYHALAASELDEPRRGSSQLSKIDPDNPGLPEETIGHAAASADEESSLLSSDSGPGDLAGDMESLKPSGLHHSLHADITGLKLLPTVDFWILFMMLGLLTGIGLMTINNIGNDSNALWRKYDRTVSRDFIARRQLVHVSMISCFSFFGRLLSGIGSDILVKRLHLSRFYCLVASSIIFFIGQFAALSVSNPLNLWLVSSISGLGYGALFGVYPALVADTFGVSGMSQNWGYMTIAPVIWGNIFNLLYGTVYDHHSRKEDNGELLCSDGIDCYRSAYVMTTIAALVAIFGALGCVYRDSKKIRARSGGVQAVRGD